MTAELRIHGLSESGVDWKSKRHSRQTMCSDLCQARQAAAGLAYTRGPRIHMCAAPLATWLKRSGQQPADPTRGFRGSQPLSNSHLHSRCARKAASTDKRRGRPCASGRHSNRSVEMMGARLEMVELACRRWEVETLSRKLPAEQCLHCVGRLVDKAAVQGCACTHFAGANAACLET